MHLLNSYSFQSGQKIGKMHLYPKYYPLPVDDYIIIQPFSKSSKNYDFWTEVLELICPILEKNNIKIIQVGGQKEKPLKYCINTAGTTSWGQLEYIVSKAKLALCTDSIAAHIASHYNIPLVDLISNNFSSCVAPYFGDKSKQIILEPDRKNLKPSFSMDEGSNKQINSIKPELVAKSVCKLLGFDFDYKFTTISFGPLYNNKTIESCLDSVIDVRQLNVPNIVVRLDINYNLGILQHQLNICPCQIITNKQVPVDILKQFRQNILGIVYEIDEDSNPAFINELIENKIGYQLISSLPENKLNLIKLNYMDFGIIHNMNKTMPEVLKNKDLKTIYYKTSKVLLSKNKYYASLYDYLNDRNFNPNENPPLNLIDKNLEKLWQDQNFTYFLEKTN
jgi:hypothetical protein